jgi:hypothetical protein
VSLRDILCTGKVECPIPKCRVAADDFSRGFQSTENREEI